MKLLFCFALGSLIAIVASFPAAAPTALIGDAGRRRDAQSEHREVLHVLRNDERTALEHDDIKIARFDLRASVGSNHRAIGTAQSLIESVADVPTEHVTGKIGELRAGIRGHGNSQPTSSRAD